MGSLFLTSGTANFFFSSLLNSALFLFCLLFLTQLHFLFCLSYFTCSIFLHIHISNASSVSPHSIFMSMFLHCTVPNSTQSISLVSFLIFLPSVCQKMCLFSLKIFFCHCYPLSDFLTAAQGGPGPVFGGSST